MTNSVDPTVRNLELDSELRQLNHSRKKCEREAEQLIIQQDLCSDIRQAMLGTFKCAQEQINKQKMVLKQFKFKITGLENHNEQLVLEKNKMKKGFEKIEKRLCSQIKEQQKVRIFKNICLIF
jgi:chromosome segregation ATPase